LVVVAVNRLPAVEDETGQVQRWLVVDVPQPGLQLCSITSTSRASGCGLFSFWTMKLSPFLRALCPDTFAGAQRPLDRDATYWDVLLVNRLPVVEAEIGQVQRRLVVDEPQPGLQLTSISSISRDSACGLFSC
jgi:hypothetical protein